MLAELLSNIAHNLFKPLLLFFYLGFAIPILRVPFEFPKQVYQGLTLYLLVAIGWHGGEELASLSANELGQAFGFMALGFVLNFAIGLFAHQILKRTKLRQIDAAAVAGYYGSDSAGTFVTALGVLTAANIAFSAYMPVMLAIMEIPGCLVALVLISRLRQRGMDINGNMPGEPDYEGPAPGAKHGQSIFSAEVLRDVFFNPGLYLLLGGILVGYIARLQGPNVTKADDLLFVDLFQGILCLFLLEMGMTAARRLRDIKNGGLAFVLFAVLAPNLFAAIGMLAAHGYAFAIGVSFPVGTYVLFAVLCAAASYIAVPAIQRLAFPEASPTLPLAASLGLTFSYNVTIGIPVYLAIAEWLTSALPITG
ncbi:MAG: sodium-dependent bicarbonate transport family permease [Nannocystaceae bacterium]